MADENKTKEQLLGELKDLRLQVAKLGTNKSGELLRVSEEKYRVLLESATDGIIVTNEHGRIELVNKRTEELFGYSRQELLGKTVEVLLPQRLRDKHNQHRNNYVKNPSAREMGQGRYLMGQRKDGQEILLEVGLSYIKTPKGVSVLSLIDDVTKRRQAEEALKKSHDQLRNLTAHLQTVREDERKRIAREIHDELGQALTALDIDLSWLLNRLLKEQQPLIEKTKSMSQLVRNTLQAVQELSAKLRPPVLDDLGLTAAIQWQLQEFQQRTGIKIELTSEPETIDLEGNLKTAIFRVFQEALVNVARHASAKNITVRMMRDTNKLVMNIQDDGKGITKHQISASDSIGLIGMQERLHPWQGTVEISGKPDQGTTITVNVALGGKIKALIADDHLVVRQGLKQILSETDDIVVVDEAGDGFEVISKVWKNEYDVLVLDISMPGKNGLEVLDELKSLKPELPVLVLSMHAENQYALRALRAGAAGYLTKAGVQDELITAIHKVVQGSKYVAPDMAETLVFDAIATTPQTLHETLSNREFQIMCLLASGKTVNEIAKSLSLGISTVSTTRTRMLTKMKMKNNAEVTYYAIKEGLVK